MAAHGEICSGGGMQRYLSGNHHGIAAAAASQWRNSIEGVNILAANSKSGILIVKKRVA